MKKVNESKAAMLETLKVADAEGDHSKAINVPDNTLTLDLPVTNDLSDRTQKLKVILRDLSQSVYEISQNVSEVKERQKQQDAERLQAEIFDKISTSAHKARYEQILQQRLDNTCTWLLKDLAFRQWRESVVSDTLLLEGKSESWMSYLSFYLSYTLSP